MQANVWARLEKFKLGQARWAWGYGYGVPTEIIGSDERLFLGVLFHQESHFIMRGLQMDGKSAQFVTRRRLNIFPGHPRLLGVSYRLTFRGSCPIWGILFAGVVIVAVPNNIPGTTARQGAGRVVGEISEMRYSMRHA